MFSLTNGRMHACIHTWYSITVGATGETRPFMTACTPVLETSHLESEWDTYVFTERAARVIKGVPLMSVSSLLALRSRFGDKVPEIWPVCPLKRNCGPNSIVLRQVYSAKRGPMARHEHIFSSLCPRTTRTVCTLKYIKTVLISRGKIATCLYGSTRSVVSRYIPIPV